MLNYFDLKKYALVGLLVRIKAEKEKLKKPTDETQKKTIEQRIVKLEKEYSLLLEEIQNIDNIEINIDIEPYI